MQPTRQQFNQFESAEICLFPFGATLYKFCSNAAIHLWHSSNYQHLFRKTKKKKKMASNKNGECWFRHFPIGPVWIGLATEKLFATENLLDANVCTNNVWHFDLFGEHKMKLERYVVYQAVMGFFSIYTNLFCKNGRTAAYFFSPLTSHRHRPSR